MALRGALDDIAQDTDARIEVFHQQRTAGTLTEQQFRKSSAATIDRANAKATVTSDRAVAADAAKAKHRPTRPAGIRPRSEQARLQKAVGDTARTPATAAPNYNAVAARRDKLGSLARGEPYSAAQKAIPKAARKQGSTGWVRQPNAGACPLCRGWSDGNVRPYSIEMARHGGCRCLQAPVFQESKRKRKSRRGLLAVGAAVFVASPVGDVLVGGAVYGVVGGRSGLLSGGRLAYMRLQALERLAMMGGRVLEKARSDLKRRGPEKYLRMVANAIGIDPYDVDINILRAHASMHEAERLLGNFWSPCYANEHIDFAVHRWLPAVLQEKYPGVARALLRSSQRWGERTSGLPGRGVPLPKMVRPGRLEREIAILDGRFAHSADTHAFLANLKKNNYTPDEIEALWDYAGLYVDPDDPTQIWKGPVGRYNQKLRGLAGPPLTEHELGVIRLVDQAIAKNTTPRDITVFRGAELSDEALARLIDGDELLDDSYLFTGLTESRALPHARFTTVGGVAQRSVLFEIELPKGSPAISSPYGIGLGDSILSRAIPVSKALIKRAFTGAAGPSKIHRIRIPFLRYFNKEELVLPRGMPMQILSSEVRADGRTVIRLLAPKPVGASRADRVDYFERLIRLAPEEDRQPLVARIMEIYSRPDFTDLDEIEDVTVAWERFQSGLEANRLRLDLDASIAAKLREIEELKKTHRLARKETIARHPTGGSQTAAHRAEMDALVADLDRMRRARRRTDTPTPSGAAGAPRRRPEPPHRITPVVAVRTVAGVKQRIDLPGQGPAMHPNLIPDNAVAKTIARQATVPGFEDLSRRTRRDGLEEIMARQTDFIVRSAERSMDLSPDATELHAGWYPFAHGWLNDLADATQRLVVPVTRNGSYAATAALSPGADWAHNVAWAKRVINAVADDVVVKREWIDARYAFEVELGYAQGRGRGVPRHRTDLIGKRLSEIDSTDDVAVALRGWHDHDAVIQLGGHPGFGDPEYKAVPQSLTNLEKAVSVLRDGSLENIDAALGGQKVRSFFNNLARPFDLDDLDVTIDTHHFGVANGFPWTTSSKWIDTKAGSINITDTPSSSNAGVHGTYPLVVEATRRATTILNGRWGTNYSPLQIQSIVWEMHRAEYPDFVRRGPKFVEMNDAIERARTLRARGRISPGEERRMVDRARYYGGAPTDSEILEWFRADAAGVPRRNLVDMRIIRQRARKAAERERKRQERRNG